MNGGSVLDKYEYNVKSDQIKKLYSRREFEAAAKIADEIDWYRVKDNAMINRVADIYENVRQYEKAKEVLLIAYERSPLGRQLAYKLTILALRTKNFVEADEFYQDFVEMSPSDVSQYLLKYRIAKAKGEDIEVLIKILEAYIDVEMDERWQYELAKLYHEAGMDDKCIAMCDELELWFNDGKYVEKAKELRKLITGMLDEYNKRYSKSDDTEENIAEENNEYIDGKVVEGTDESEDEEDRTGIKSLAEALVASQDERMARREEDMKLKREQNSVEDDGLEPLDDSMKDEEEEDYLDDDINPDEVRRAEVDVAAKEIAKRAAQAEASIPVETEEERRANEALKAAETAALEAQKAADMAKKLVMEARLRAEQVKAATKSESDNFMGMTAKEISKSLEDEELLKGDVDINKKDSMIEIFEFDKSKDGKCSNIGEELTKTAEIDIDQINIKLAETDNLYNTANIQAALAKSMEKLLNDEKQRVRNAFEMQIDDEQNEIRPVDGYEEKETTEDKEEPEELEQVSEEAAGEETEELSVSEEEPEELEQVSEEVAGEETEELSVSEEEPEEFEQVSEEVAEEETEEDYLADEFDGEPTKRIDRAEINRILNASKMLNMSERKSERQITTNTDNEGSDKLEKSKDNDSEQEQIEGQMTIDEVLAEYERIEAEKKAEDLANIETEDDVEEIRELLEALDENISDDNVSGNIVQETEQGENNLDEDLEEAAEDEAEDEEDAQNEDNEDVDDKDGKEENAINNHKIPEEYKSLFSDFVGTGSMEELIADTLDNLINHFVMDGTSKTNNVIVTGSAKIGKTTLGLSIIKAANRGRNRSGRKVAKVKASALNKRGVALAMTQILGTDLIIEQAGNLMPNTIVDLMIAMKNYTEEMLIVLEDDKAAIDRMLDNAPELKEFFTNRLDIHEMEIDDMVKIAKDYAGEQFYSIDEIGELALYAKLDDISGRNPVMSIEDIQEVVDEAIEHANRFSLGKLFGRMKKNKGEMGTLTEQDFL
jgi:hypothetical protein